MSGRNFGYLKRNRRITKKIFILSVLLISFLLTPFLNNFNIYNNLNEDNQKNKELPIKILKTQDLTTDNTFSGTGAPWNVSHWANRTDYNLPVSFGNGSSDTVNMDLGSGWEGYQLNATINDLYDERNWVNGTFEAGNDDNDGSAGDDDSYKLVNWTFGEADIVGWSNDMSGNYFNSTNDPSGTSNNCIELRMDGGNTGYAYNQFDKCWWETLFTIPRGDVIEGEISLALYPYTQYNPQGGAGDYGTHWSIQAILNEVVIDDKNLIWLETEGKGGWVSLTLQLTNWLEDPTVFPSGVKNMNLTIQLIRNGGSADFDVYGLYQQVLIDNVSLTVKAEAKPEQIELKMNDLPVSDINWGNGTVGQINTWTTTTVEAKFNASEVRPPEMGGYEVEFKTDLNLFAKKLNIDSDHQPNYPGTSFEVRNDSSVEWQSYARVSVPTGYEETNMTIEFPEDVNITWISNAEEPNTNILKYCDNSTLGILKVYNFSETPDGFWWVKGESPNYCTELNIYNDVTGQWILNNTFLSGDSINITGKIESAGLDITGYIGNTKAKLYIRFPNGTIWTAANQIKQVNTTGIVYFDPFQIPNSPPDYYVGEYQAIITWNNSYSSFNLNETGLIYKTFTVSHNSSLEPDQYYYPDIFVGDIVNIKVSFNDLKNDKPIETATVYAKNFTEGTQYFNEISPGYYFLEFNTTGGSGGDQNLTIYATHPLYEEDKVNVTIGLIEYTTLTAEEYPSIKVPWNNNFTIHLNYTETSTGNSIKAATTTVYWNGDTFIDSANGIYNVTCNNTAYQVNDAHNLKIELNKTGYESQTIIISIELVERETNIDEIFINDADCTANKSYNIHSGESMNITVKFKDTEAGGTLIHNAMVTLNGTDIGEIFTDNNNFYNLTLNSTKLSVGISFLNIIAQKDNFTAVTELLTINVYERETDYWVYLNGAVQGQNPSIQLYANQFLNITISYNDSIDLEHIPNAIVDINGSGISEILVESFNNYSVLINTTDLNQGVNFLTIFVRKDSYEAHSVLLIIEIIQIETDLILFLDGEDKTSNPSITLNPTQTLNITISYNDSIAAAHIPNAIVDINGSGISEILVESFNNYSVLINTADLDQGANLLSIYARKKNYEPQAILLIIQIIQIETNLTLFLDGEDKTSNPSITLYPTQTLNITISYNDSIAVAHIPNAIVDINGSGISEILVESFNNYSVLINTADLNQGANFLTIFARKDGYEPQTILLIIQIIQIETNLTLFLDGNPKNDGDTIQVEFDDTINVTVYYRDIFMQQHLSNANISLLGVGDLSEINNQYTIIIDANDLGQGFTALTIFAQLANYEAQSINFFISVVEKATNLQLFLNGEDKTLTPVFNLTIGEILNVTVRYKEQTGAYIPNVSLQLIGEGIPTNFIRDDVLEQHYIQLNTLNLKIGVNFYSIVARTTDYEIQTINLIITVNRIRTLISTTSGESYINALPGGSIRLKIRLNNTDFGGLIKNATVTYRWAYGQGELLDIDNDGVYEVEIKNIPAGTYTIYISASAGDNYNFESYEITLNAVAVSGPDFTMLFLTLSGAFVALVVGFTLYQTHYKYPPTVRKSRKIRKKIRKGKKTKPLTDIASREDLIKDHLKSNVETIQLEKKTENGLKEK